MIKYDLLKKFLGSDLVTSLSRTLDKKLQKLRSSQTEATLPKNQNEFEQGAAAEQAIVVKCKILSEDMAVNGAIHSDKPSTVPITVDGNKRPSGKSRFGGNGIKRNWRRNSMIERRVNGESCNGGRVIKEHTSCDDKEYYRNPSLHRLTGVRIFTNLITQ